MFFFDFSVRYPNKKRNPSPWRVEPSGQNFTFWLILWLFFFGLFQLCWFISIVWNYCWWKKSCTKNLVNNGMNYQPQLVIAGFLPSTVFFGSLSQAWEQNGPVNLQAVSAGPCFMASILGGGFKWCFIFTPIWGRFSIWLIFFKWVETTNQNFCILTGWFPTRLDEVLLNMLCFPFK